MKRLRAAEDRGERLDRRARNVVVRLLRCQAHPRSLAVGAHRPRTRILRADPVAHHARPKAARRAQLADLFEEVVVDVPEKGDAWRHEVGRQAALDRLGHIAVSSGQRERQLLHGVGAGFADVVAGDADRVVARHHRGRVFHRVHYQANRRCWRIDVLVLCRVLLQDIVLDSARDLLSAYALRLGNHFVHPHQHESRSIYGVGGRHLVQRDVLHQQANVLHSVNGYADLADLR